MKKKKFVLILIALFTLFGGAFAVKNYSNMNSLYTFNASTGLYLIVVTYAASASSFIATTTLNNTYYRWTGSTFTPVPPGTIIYVVNAQ